jgi:hypothetical protein
VRGSLSVRGLMLLVSGLLLLAVGVGSAIAAVPNANGKFYACRVSNTGAVRIINYPKVSTCPTGQKLISWNAQGPQGAAGPAGPAGPAGAQGPQGLQGPAGTAGITKINLTTVTANGPVAANNTFAGATVTCPAGKVVGGGHSMSGSPVNIVFYQSRPVGVNQWVVGAWNASGQNLTITAYAICMTTDPGTVIARKKGSIRPAGDVINPETGKRKK